MTSHDTCTLYTLTSYFMLTCTSTNLFRSYAVPPVISPSTLPTVHSTLKLHVVVSCYGISFQFDAVYCILNKLEFYSTTGRAILRYQISTFTCTVLSIIYMYNMLVYTYFIADYLMSTCLSHDPFTCTCVIRCEWKRTVTIIITPDRKYQCI